MIGTSAPSVKASPRLGFQFRPLPVAVESLGLPSTALHLFTILIDDAKRRGWRTRLTNAALGARLNRSVATVKRLLALLESRGLIVRELAADGRIRIATKITWDGVAHSRPTDNRTVAHSQAGGGSLAIQGVAHSCATNSESPVQSAFQTPGFSTSEEEKRDEPAPSPAETAAALRAMIAGKWAPMIFDDAKSEGSSASSASTTSPATSPSTSTTTPMKAPPPKPSAAPRKPDNERVAPHGGLDLFRAVKGAAPAAWSTSWGAAPKITQSESLRRFDEWKAKRKQRGRPSPPPVGCA